MSELKFVIWFRIKGVYADQKLQMEVFIPTVGISQATWELGAPISLQYVLLSALGADQRYRMALQNRELPAAAPAHD